MPQPDTRPEAPDPHLQHPVRASPHTCRNVGAPGAEGTSAPGFLSSGGWPGAGKGRAGWEGVAASMYARLRDCSSAGPHCPRPQLTRPLRACPGPGVLSPRSRLPAWAAAGACRDCPHLLEGQGILWVSTLRSFPPGLLVVFVSRLMTLSLSQAIGMPLRPSPSQPQPPATPSPNHPSSPSHPPRGSFGKKSWCPSPWQAGPLILGSSLSHLPVFHTTPATLGHHLLKV